MNCGRCLRNIRKRSVFGWEKVPFSWRMKQCSRRCLLGLDEVDEDEKKFAIINKE